MFCAWVLTTSFISIFYQNPLPLPLPFLSQVFPPCQYSYYFYHSFLLLTYFLLVSLSSMPFSPHLFLPLETLISPDSSFLLLSPYSFSSLFPIFSTFIFVLPYLFKHQHHPPHPLIFHFHNFYPSSICPPANHLLCNALPLSSPDSSGSDAIFCCLRANIFDRVGAYKIYYQ